MKQAHTLWMGLVGAVVAGAALLGPWATRSSRAGSEAKPDVVLLAGVPGESSTDVLLVKLSGAEVSKKWGKVQHVPGAVVRGAVLPGGHRAVVVADTVASRDLSWAASLMLVQPTKPTKQLVDGVYHASRPLVLPSGRVLVERGSAGPAPQPGHYRVDDLHVDEVDPDTGTVRTVYSWSGFETYLAGQYDQEVYLYRVGPGHADLIAVRLDGGSVRVVVPSWPAYARDFSVDAVHKRLVVQQLSSDGDRDWVVQTVDMKTGRIRQVARSKHRDMVPFAWPDGTVLVNESSRRQVSFVASHGTERLLPTAEPGAVLWARTVSRDGRWVGALWKVPSKLPRPVVIRSSDRTVMPVTLREPWSRPPRMDVIGVVGGGAS